VSVIPLPHSWQRSLNDVDICEEVGFKGVLDQIDRPATLSQLFDGANDSYAKFNQRHFPPQFDTADYLRLCYQVGRLRGRTLLPLQRLRLDTVQQP
jgi:hypothetical protein